MIRRSTRTILFGILTFLGVSLSLLLVSEAALRCVPAHRVPPAKYLFWSRPAFEAGPGGSVTLAKKALVREAAVYGGRIEYDMTYQTNNYGSVDTVDYPLKESGTGGRRFAFIGDSFTAGSGGYAWVPKLRERWNARGHSDVIYNLGLPAAGFVHFRNNLEHVDPDLRFTDIVIFAISDDFRRRFWVPLEFEDKILFCSDPTDLRRGSCGPIADVIGLDATADDILALVSKLELKNSEDDRIKARQSPLWSFLKSLRVVRAAYQGVRAWSFSQRIRENTDRSFIILRQLRNQFPDTRICLFHLPEKDEVARGQYRYDWKNRVEELGIEYYPSLHRNSWSEGMFHEHDTHPTSEGYDRLTNFVEGWLADSLRK